MSDAPSPLSEAEHSSVSLTHGTVKKFSILLALMLVVVWYFWGGSNSNSSNQRASLASGISSSAEPSGLELVNATPSVTDEEQRRFIVGKWETDRSGRRELTVSDDGTAKMDVTIENTFARMLLGNRIVLFLDWKIENGILTLTTTGGEPSSKVNVMTSMYGKDRTQKIIELNETTLHHPDDEPDGEDHIWKRITE